MPSEKLMLDAENMRIQRLFFPTLRLPEGGNGEGGSKRISGDGSFRSGSRTPDGANASHPHRRRNRVPLYVTQPGPFATAGQRSHPTGSMGQRGPPVKNCRYAFPPDQRHCYLKTAWSLAVV